MWEKIEKWGGKSSFFHFFHNFFHFFPFLLIKTIRKSFSIYPISIFHQYYSTRLMNFSFMTALVFISSLSCSSEQHPASPWWPELGQDFPPEKISETQACLCWRGFWGSWCWWWWCWRWRAGGHTSFHKCRSGSQNKHSTISSFSGNHWAKINLEVKTIKW